MYNVPNRAVFSLFEQRLHKRRKQGPFQQRDLTRYWKKSLNEIYGEQAEIFDYSHTENLWCTESVLIWPFYEYSYPFAELVAQQMFSKQKELGKKKFGDLIYLVFSAGDTLSIQELLLKFGLDIEDENFWTDSLKLSLGSWLKKLKHLGC